MDVRTVTPPVPDIPELGAVKQALNSLAQEAFAAKKAREI
jgi:HAMP domain-containing protein